MDDRSSWAVDRTSLLNPKEHERHKEQTRPSRVIKPQGAMKWPVLPYTQR